MKKTTEGYFLVALGEKFIVESSMIVLTLRKFHDTRPVSVLVHAEHVEYAKSIGVFDKVIEFNPSGEDWDDCATNFEKYAVYPRINLDKYACYDRNMMLDTDVLCTHGTQRVWNLMSDREIGMIGTIYDPTWHWGTINQVIEAYGKHIPHVHGGFLYFRKGNFLDEFMCYCREVFMRFDEYKCKRFFRNGRSEEIILAIAHSKFDVNPLEFTNNVIGFNYEEKDHLPFFHVNSNHAKENQKEPVVFAHMLSKFGGKEYNDLLKKILTPNLCIVEPDMVVSLRYVLTDKRTGEKIEEANEQDPMILMCGVNSVIQDFEVGISGKKVGDSFDFTIPRSRAYGDISAENFVDLPLNFFFSDEPKIDTDVVFNGAVLPMIDNLGNQVIGKVVHIGQESVRMDFNHRLAGRDLNFKGEILQIRPATEEELRHKTVL